MKNSFIPFTPLADAYSYIRRAQIYCTDTRCAILLRKMIFVFLVLVTAGTHSVNAQTCTCTIHTAAIDTNTYVLNQGQLLCVDSGSVFLGKISLAGGEFCISGTANPSSVEFVQTSIGGSSGKITINAHAALSTKSNFSIGKISLIVNPKGVLNITGDLALIVSGSTINNQGIINIQNKLQLNVGCSITNNGNINYVILENLNGVINGSGNLISATETSQQ